MSGTAVVVINGKEWSVNIANTPSELLTGLAGVESIPAGTGMLFDLGAEEIITVTAEEMLFPVDVIFINSDLLVTEVAFGLAPGDWGTATIPAQYFLEVNVGEAVGVEAGDEVSITITTPPTLMSSIMPLMVLVLVFGLISGMMRSLIPPEKKPTALVKYGHHFSPRRSGEPKSEKERRKEHYERFGSKELPERGSGHYSTGTVDNVEVYTSRVIPERIAQDTGLHIDPQTEGRYTTYYYGTDLGYFERDLRRLLIERTGYPALGVTTYYIRGSEHHSPEYLEPGGLIKVIDAETGELKRWETPGGVPLAIMKKGKLTLTELGERREYLIKDNKLVVKYEPKHSIHGEPRRRLVEEYGSWAVGRSEAICPEDDIACVEREAKRLIETIRGRYGEEAMRYVTIVDPGKTVFHVGDVVSIVALETENRRVRELGEREATYQ